MRPPWNRGLREKPIALPRNKTDALKLFNCYGQAQDAELEPDDPRIGCVLDASEAGRGAACAEQEKNLTADENGFSR